MPRCLHAGVARYSGSHGRDRRDAPPERGGVACAPLPPLLSSSSSSSMPSLGPRAPFGLARRSVSAARLRPARALEDAAWEQAEHEGFGRRLRAPRVEPVVEHCLRAFLAHSVDELVQYLPDATVDRCLDLQDFEAAAHDTQGLLSDLAESRPPLTLAAALAASRDIPGELFIDARASRALVLSRPRRAAVRSSLRASPGRHLVRMAVVGGSGEAAVATLELRLEETLAPSYCGAGIEVQWVMGRLTAEPDGREERWEEEKGGGNAWAGAEERAGRAGRTGGWSGEGGTGGRRGGQGGLRWEVEGLGDDGGMERGDAAGAGSEAFGSPRGAPLRDAPRRALNDARLTTARPESSALPSSSSSSPLPLDPLDGSPRLAWNPMGGDPRPELPAPWSREGDNGAHGSWSPPPGNSPSEGPAALSSSAFRSRGFVSPEQRFSSDGSGQAPSGFRPPPRLFSPPAHALGPSPHLGPEEAVSLLLAAVRAGQLGPARRWLSAGARRQLPDADALRAALREREGSALLAHAGARIAAVTQEGPESARVVAEVICGPGRARRYELACVLEPAAGRRWATRRDAATGVSSHLSRQQPRRARIPRVSAWSRRAARAAGRRRAPVGRRVARALRRAIPRGRTATTRPAGPAEPAAGPGPGAAAAGPGASAVDEADGTPVRRLGRGDERERAASEDDARAAAASARASPSPQRASDPHQQQHQPPRALRRKRTTPSPLASLSAFSSLALPVGDADRVWVVNEMKGVDDDDDWAWGGHGTWTLPQ